MKNRFAQTLCVVALCQLLGGHWVFLQTGAWAGMIVQYSRQVGLKAGLAQAFDGEHPCPICKVIQDGKKQEQKKAPLLNAELKKDYLAVCNGFQVYQGWVEAKYLGSAKQLQSVVLEPAEPPPRS